MKHKRSPRPTYIRLVEDEPSRSFIEIDWGPWIVWILAIGFVLALVTSTFDRPLPDDPVPPRIILEEQWEADPSFWYEGNVSEPVRKDLERLRP